METQFWFWQNLICHFILVPTSESFTLILTITELSTPLTPNRQFPKNHVPIFILHIITTWHSIFLFRTFSVYTAKYWITSKQSAHQITEEAIKNCIKMSFFPYITSFPPMSLIPPICENYEITSVWLSLFNTHPNVLISLEKYIRFEKGIQKRIMSSKYVIFFWLPWVCNLLRIWCSGQS